MSKSNLELLEEFKKIEQQIIDCLKSSEISFDENSSRKNIMTDLKSYISKVKDAEKLFDEYEKIAKKLSKVASDDAKNHTVVEAVVDMREEPEEIKTEIIDIDNNVVIKKKKKKITGVSKEF